ncbi:MAG: hypothetical protein EYC70_02405 [Planctomycetota bacterium]|nr:MAG: hypothetical protein EYC70_02405 [Planctomycetota bacterium]
MSIRLSTFAALLATGLLAGTLVSAPRNDADRFWDAFAQQGATDLKSTYKESPENGLLDQSLEIQLEDGAANTMMTATVNGRRVGRFRTNGIGDGGINRDRFGVVPGPDGRPPKSQRINDGDVLRVFGAGTDISATYAERP